MRDVLLYVTASLMLTAPLSEAAAEPAKQACAPGPATMPLELMQWPSRSPASAATKVSELASAPLVIGAAVNATLRPSADVQYVVPPGKPGEPSSFGGMFEFTVVQAGTYRVALGAGSWATVLSGKKPVVSAAHGRGPDCSGIRKMVDFALKPGDYVLQLESGAETPMAIMIARMPE